MTVKRNPPILDWKKVESLMDDALWEDVRTGDITTELLFEDTVPCRAVIVAKQPGVLAGLPVAGTVFEKLDANLKLETVREDGDSLAAGDEIAFINGSQRHILTGERLALNILQRLSGIATFTAKFVEAVAETGVKIADTRKTAPGMRELEKYAVRLGGGTNHRFGLYDGILIKDNHIKLSGGVAEAVAKVKKSVNESPDNLERFQVEVEAKHLSQVSQAIDAGADIVMLDNMSPEQMREAVRIADGRVTIEVSGGITLEKVATVASLGVDVISVGALTHSAPALDISLDMV